jgi:hypothetical protein
MAQRDRSINGAAGYWPAAATPMRTRISTAEDDKPIISASFVEEAPALSLKSATTVFM